MRESGSNQLPAHMLDGEANNAEVLVETSERWYEQGNFKVGGCLADCEEQHDHDHRPGTATVT